MVLMLMSINLPIPNGCFMPIFVIGAILGRLYGELMHDAFGEDLHLPAAAYAVIGAAALTAGATQTLSTSLITLELTNQQERREHPPSHGSAHRTGAPISASEAAYAEGPRLRRVAVSGGRSGHGWRTRETRRALRRVSPGVGGLCAARLARTAGMARRVGNRGERPPCIAARGSSSSEDGHLCRVGMPAPVNHATGDAVVPDVVDV